MHRRLANSQQQQQQSQGKGQAGALYTQPATYVALAKQLSN